ncbi:benzoate/H(+) symporter BenE family transporter [Actinotalea sp. K2]|uniref:benzoate/H(+) symporter BenE family transporter n=1 Tax=Actinotalea sp. K2 TaxID=2939438 RepID=UPI002016E27D|nr:benzoate/H(+) symporter BenE family transporter [Actinotalea sp. K2]MCL3860310.1 benzoate/H(+) symporter BenE family transporter [Actinotalea sp. K2]
MPSPASSHILLAGLVTTAVGFLSAFAVVLAGLRAVGASPAQAASGLLAVTVGMGLATILLSVRTRLPITIAWSTPGAALLATTGAVDGGWPAAVGAFAVCGVLLAVVGLWGRLAALTAHIPATIASAMLAGVLLDLCLAPVRALETTGWLVAPVIGLWVVLLRLAPRWAAPAGLVVATGLAFTSADVRALPAATWLPTLEWTAPTLGVASVVSLAVPLFVVTMASQNLPGVAVLAGFGYVAPWRRVLLTTGVGTMLVAPFGGHALNLAAISAALAAGPEAGADRGERWRAATTAGVGYVAVGLGSAGVAAVALAAPGGLIEAAAGLALVATLAASLRSAFSVAPHAVAAAATFLVTVSGVRPWGVGSAFWGLVAGVVLLALTRLLRRPRLDI